MKKKLKLFLIIFVIAFSIICFSSDVLAVNVKNYDTKNLVSCGSNLITDMPKALPKTIHILYMALQIAVPVLLVVFGSLDFLKALIAQKDDEIKKGQQIFIKRLIYGIIVFFVFAIVKIVISFAADNKTKIMNCASCLINNDKNCVAGDTNAKKVKYLLILLLFLILVNVDSVSAKCYKVKDSHTGKIYYTNVVSDLQSYEIPSLVDDSECRKNSSTYKSVGIDTNNVVSCGNIGSFHKKIPELTSWVINLIQVAVPVILIIMGSFDFVKAIASQKDDEIKKGQQVFIKRIITAIIIFFIVVIVKMLVSVVSSGKAEKKNIVSCIDCFISNKCS